MKKMKKLFGGLLIMIVTFACAAKDQYPEGLYAKINTTKGTILIKLEMEKTPMTVANFVGLAEGKIKNNKKPNGTPFYDGIKFHRVIANFMIQCGDPTGTGAGEIGYAFKDEFDASLKHDRAGTLSMANKGPATNSSQFFITHKDTPWLDGKHTVFGYVIEGLSTIDLIAQGDEITTVEIIRSGKAANKFDAPSVFANLSGIPQANN